MRVGPRLRTTRDFANSRTVTDVMRFVWPVRAAGSRAGTRLRGEATGYMTWMNQRR
jgi:hypothetical protein